MGEEMCDADDSVWTVPVMCSKPLWVPFPSTLLLPASTHTVCYQAHNTQGCSPHGQILHCCGWTERHSNKSEKINWAIEVVDSHCLFCWYCIISLAWTLKCSAGQVNSQHAHKWFVFNNTEYDLLKVFLWPFKVAPRDIVSSLTVTAFAKQTEMRKWAINHLCFADDLKWWMS